MHVYYRATVKHESGTSTEFLALDKPLPKRTWILPFKIEKDEKGKVTMEEIDWETDINTFKRRKIDTDINKDLNLASSKPIDEENKSHSNPKEEIKKLAKVYPKIYYDLEWAAITKVTDPLMSLKMNADYYQLINSDNYYETCLPLKHTATNCDIKFSELKKAKEEAMINLKLVIENKEVFPMSLKEEDGCNEQTKGFLNLLEINSKLYKKAEEFVPKIETEKEIDISDFI